MKFLIIPYIALGLTLALVVGVVYDCVGTETFPRYFGSPFVFKQASLASSMEYYYSILGLLSNMLCWSLVLFFADRILRTFKKKKRFLLGYKVLVGLFIVFSTLMLIGESSMIGPGFDKNGNYWYWNLDNKAAEWGMECQAKWKIVWLDK